ncbi:MAG: arsenic metallochaperone ArsD family protein [Dehalococcoidia bacterium]|nr:arsenic metallochaperone ArsD family protein [Dehalococcoidia bacterium]
MTETRLVEIFEMPACGDPRAEDSHNPELRRVNQMTRELESEGVTVRLYSMNDNMNLFMQNPKVATMVFQQRLKVLPITVVNGNVIKVESYPTIEEVRSALVENDGVAAPRGP